MNKQENEKDDVTQLASKRTQLAYERNRLANHRTFLAWIRTGLASVCGGIIVLKWPLFELPLYRWVSKGLGATFLLIGVAIFIISYTEYKGSFSLMEDELEPPSTRFLIWSIASILVATTSLYLLIVLMELVFF